MKHLNKITKEINKNKKVREGIKIKIWFNIMRIMQLKDIESDPTEKEYWQNKGWLGKEERGNSYFKKLNNSI